MKKDNNILTGITFLLLAVFILIGSMGWLGEISVWTLVFSFVFAVWFVKSVLKLEWFGIFFPLAFLAILWDERLGIEQLTPWPVLGAALLGTIGMNMIFGHSRTHFHFGHKIGDAEFMAKGGICDEQSEDDYHFTCESVFSSSVKYINCQNLQHAQIENVFGSMQIYLDNARLCNGRAMMKIENVFGSVVVYVPKEWKTVVRFEKVFAGGREFGNCNMQSDNLLEIVGETVFGNIEIKYI